MFQTEGFKGLYRGFGINVCGSIPASGLYFGSYEYFKIVSQKSEYLTAHPNITHLAGGLFAELIACALFVPVDVVKERR